MLSYGKILKTISAHLPPDDENIFFAKMSTKSLEGIKKYLSLQSQSGKSGSENKDGAVAQMVEHWTENPCVG
ncbi:MAG: hypothetical protein IJ584_03635, partial [Bacteroidales bacterium]|nr:hypothetical protein [Bacteroidales bacterium]